MITATTVVLLGGWLLFLVAIHLRLVGHVSIAALHYRDGDSSAGPHHHHQMNNRIHELHFPNLHEADVSLPTRVMERRAVAGSWPPSQFRLYTAEEGSYVVTWVAGREIAGQQLELRTTRKVNNDTLIIYIDAIPKDMGSTAPADKLINGGKDTVWYAKTSKLQSRSKYFYTVGAKDVSEFVVEPLKAFAIAVVGDVGVQWTAPLTKMALNMDKTFEALIMPGDLTYGNGNPAKWDSYMQGMQASFERVPLFTCPGNHDGRDEFTAWEDDQMTAYDLRLTPTATVASSASDSQWYYSFDMAGIHFVSLCNDAICREHGIDKQLAWLEKDLAAASRRREAEPDKYPWIIAYQHRCLYCSTNPTICHGPLNHGSDLVFRERFEPLYYKYGVDVVFSGHDHVYERTHPLLEGELDDEGLVHIQIGTGGHNVKRNYGCWPKTQLPMTAKRDGSVTGYARLTVEPNRRKLVFQMLSIDHHGCDPQSKLCSEQLVAGNEKKGGKPLRLTHKVIDEFIIPARVASKKGTTEHENTGDLAAEKDRLSVQQDKLVQKLKTVQDMETNFEAGFREMEDTKNKNKNNVAVAGVADGDVGATGHLKWPPPPPPPPPPPTTQPPQKNGNDVHGEYVWVDERSGV